MYPLCFMEYEYEKLPVLSVPIAREEMRLQ